MEWQWLWKRFRLRLAMLQDQITWVNKNVIEILHWCPSSHFHSLCQWTEKSNLRHFRCNKFTYYVSRQRVSVCTSVQSMPKRHKKGKLFGEKIFSLSSSWSENCAKGSRLYANSANTRSQQHPDSAGWKEEDEGNSHSLSRVGECEQQAGLPRLTRPLSFARAHNPPVRSINPVTVVPQMECFIRD